MTWHFPLLLVLILSVSLWREPLELRSTIFLLLTEATMWLTSKVASFSLTLLIPILSFNRLQVVLLAATIAVLNYKLCVCNASLATTSRTSSVTSTPVLSSATVSKMKPSRLLGTACLVTTPVKHVLAPWSTSVLLVAWMLYAELLWTECLPMDNASARRGQQTRMEYAIFSAHSICKGDYNNNAILSAPWTHTLSSNTTNP